jgi:hypothetical protein
VEVIMFRRFRNLGLNATPLNIIQLQTLNQANQLVKNGQPARAAPLFARLASAMEAGNHPRRAANLHAQAAHAYADSHNAQDAMVHARFALALFIQYQMVNRTPMFYANITRKLANQGMQPSADALVKEFGPQVGAIPVTPSPAGPARGNLPTNCPKCGGPLHNDSATWVDANTVECDYCGSSIRSS